MPIAKTPEEILSHISERYGEIFRVNNHTSDSVIAKFDTNGNILPSDASERFAFYNEIKEDFRSAMQSLLEQAMVECEKERYFSMKDGMVNIDSADARIKGVDACITAIKSLQERI